MPLTIADRQVASPLAWLRSQRLAYVGLAGGVATATWRVHSANPLYFGRLLGSAEPVAAMVLVGFLGLLLLSALQARGWFTIFEVESLESFGFITRLAAGLASLAILLDLVVTFPADLNVPLPAALLFYPSIALLVEVVFHLLPLTLLLLLLTTVLPGLGTSRAIGISILLVSLLEPAYQAFAMASSGRFPPWAVAYVGVLVFLVNVFQLLLFKRRDFFSMYAFRLAYYLVWHVAWGSIRLHLLF